MRVGWIVAALAVAAPGVARAVEPFVDVEIGVAWAGYDDVRIPGDGGTLISLTDDLDASAAPYFRVRLGATFARRHTLFAFFTPLRLESRGTLPSEVAFAGETFAAGDEVLARFRFDSPRLTYRYGLLRRERLDLDVGVTAKIREAAISLQGDRYAERTDTGFVPLLSFRVAWRLTPALALVLDGDALAAPQGRAEDVVGALEVTLREGVRARVGYRLLEGGADNDEVYTFSLVHHLGAGITVAL
ncbi:hypothetical protein [Anaeromyxobacter sp. Fw109-5]|uniref:hypothetical protein n=1 Tax=Anaeromyxobacter sp. (strain Fw109-5) TaxID=404589 RepID=UPI0000ED81CC|nr:hypothetical protein [Anaeromyxobacter sp. Fw109-5]ABS25965.1 hypothetical protein Anae109_1762 [Anaeromyxobacter sp. Fw109-5]